VIDPAAVKPARVLLVTDAVERGGAEVVMETLARRLDARRYSVVLAAPHPSALSDRWRDMGWPLIPMPPAGRLSHVAASARRVAGLKHAIAEARIDFVHTHGVGAQLHAGLAARRAGRPVVFHLHDVHETGWSADALLQRAALRVPSAAVIAISETVAASIRERVPASRLSVVPDGVDETLVPPMPLDDPAPLVVWCGRLQRWKGCHLFLEAAKLVHGVRPDIRFAVVGGTLFGQEPGYREALVARTAALGLDEVVRFAGHVDDARPWLAAASMLVHSSVRPEPFGLVMAEAMMQGRPVVAFRQGGAAEIVADGETGLLVPPPLHDDVRGLARAVLDLAGDTARAAGMGAAGRQRALARFSADAMARGVEAVYDRVGEWRPAAPARAT
jgi:glycosyltransferase involved in cell wall biosynthesis